MPLSNILGGAAIVLFILLTLLFSLYLINKNYCCLHLYVSIAHAQQVLSGHKVNNSPLIQQCLTLGAQVNQNSFDISNAFKANESSIWSMQAVILK